MLMLAAAILVSGCAASFLDTASRGIFQKEKVNLTERNYAAADYMIQQADTFVKKYQLIKVRPLTDGLEPQMSSALGKMIPEQVGIRLAQLGYRMDLQEVVTDPNTGYLKPALNPGEQPRYILSGTYLRNRRDLDVKLRITDTRDSRVVSVFDYTLPMSSEVGELSEPRARIFRTAN